jgi:cobalt-zinc-cadmium efflux system membrane fusion protein
MNRNDLINKRTTRALASTIASATMLFVFAVPTFASPGHDHGDEAPAASGNGPKRLPDGGVFLPKPAQRQIGVRTRPTEASALPRTIELQGKVVMDPNAGGRVQPMQAGRIEPGPRGLPALGQAVRKGEVLAFVMPSTGALERSNQTAQGPASFVLRVNSRRSASHDCANSRIPCLARRSRSRRAKSRA